MMQTNSKITDKRSDTITPRKSPRHVGKSKSYGI